MAFLFACFLVLLMSPVPEANAQQEEDTSEDQPPRREVRVDVGGGWGIPIDNVDLQFQDGEGTLAVDVRSGPHAYAGIGFVRSIADQFALGARLRGQATRLRTTVDVCEGDVTCEDPEGLQWVATFEGRIIITSPDWINPYLLVGLGVVHTTVDSVTVQDSEGQSFPFEESSVVDAGGDIGIGASIPISDHFYFDAEFRVTGALPGGKENDVTVLPFSAGFSYGF